MNKEFWDKIKKLDGVDLVEAIDKKISAIDFKVKDYVLEKFEDLDPDGLVESRSKFICNESAYDILYFLKDVMSYTKGLKGELKTVYLFMRLGKDKYDKYELAYKYAFRDDRKEDLVFPVHFRKIELGTGFVNWFPLLTDELEEKEQEAFLKRQLKGIEGRMC